MPTTGRCGRGRLGRLEGVEDDVKVSAEDSSYTDPDQVEEFVSAPALTPRQSQSEPPTGPMFKPGKPQLRFDILEEAGAPPRLPHSAARSLSVPGVC